MAGPVTSSSCQQDAFVNLQSVISTTDYDWCAINTNLKQLLNWYDKDYSWAKSVWFDELAWSPDTINYGPRAIFTSQQIMFIMFSVLANAYILFYHYTNPPHPKYSFSWMSRLAIRTHLLSGTIGVLLPLYVFFTTHQPSAVVCMFICFAWDLVFTSTAAYQAPNVYGVRSVTVPLYCVCIFFKLVINACLIQSLVQDPLGSYKEKVTWMWMCWVVHQTYAWVRVWYYIFFWADVLHDHQYTISVSFAGAMCVGSVFGFYLFLIWMVTMVCNYLVIYYQTLELEKQSKVTGITPEIDRKAKVLAYMWKEAHANIFRSKPDSAEAAIKLCQENGVDPLDPNVLKIGAVSNSIKAKILFNSIDVDRSGEITVDELEVFLMSFGVFSVAERAMSMFRQADTDNSGTIDLQEFEKSFAAFYLYAFDGLISWIQIVNAKNCRYILDGLADNKRLLRFKYVRTCPFMLNQDGEVSADPHPAKLSPLGTMVGKENHSGGSKYQLVQSQEEIQVELSGNLKA